uniref:Uncharacterized protein n=1 Tax=Anguilla anguilla TaxID=7936 RepID=A0A0E9RJX4_ANGAN
METVGSGDCQSGYLIQAHQKNQSHAPVRLYGSFPYQEAWSEGRDYLPQ